MNKAAKNPEQKPNVLCGNEPNSLINVIHNVRVTNSKKHSYCIRQWTVPIYTACQLLCWCGIQQLVYTAVSNTHTHTPTWDCDVTAQQQILLCWRWM